MNRVMNNFTVNGNEETVYKEVELLKISVKNITHTPKAYNEHFPRKFDKIMNEIKHYLLFRFNDIEKEPLNCMVTLFDFEVRPTLFKGSEKLRKFGFEEVKKIAEDYYLRNIITAEENSLENTYQITLVSLLSSL